MYSAHGTLASEWKTQEEADEDCQTRDGHLIWFETREEWDLLAGTLRSLINVSIRLFQKVFSKQIRLFWQVLTPIRAIFDVKTAPIGVKTCQNKRICLEKIIVSIRLLGTREY